MRLGGFAALDPLAQQYYFSGQWSGDDPIACEQAGGRVSVWYGRIDQYGRGMPPVSFRCTLPVAPVAPASAPAPVTVTSTVQTQTSPQISPVFTQQDEPRESPVGAATVQQSPSPQSASGGAAELLEYLKSREAAERTAREQAGSGNVYVPPPPVTYDETADTPAAAGATLPGSVSPGMLGAVALIVGAALLMRNRKGT